MKCYYHPDREIVATCTECGKGLCKACASKWDPILCDDCAAERIAEKRAALKRSIALGVVLWAVAFAFFAFNAIRAGQFLEIFTALLMGYALGGVPSGWSAMNKIQPSMFLFLPLIGWVIYFVVKFVLAIFVGVVAFPMNLYRFWKGNKEADAMEQRLGDR